MKIFKLVISLLVVLWCAGFFYFISHTNNISNSNRNITEAIIVYGGSRERIHVGAQLLKLGYAPVIYITGDKPADEYDNFIKANNLIKAQFIFDKELTTNNLEPVSDSIEFMKKYKLSTARVVIDSTQVPRAKIDFATKLPIGVKFIPHAVSKKDARTSRIFIEYAKYTLMLIASILGLENEFNLSYS